jgi:MFS family permease
VVYVLAYLGFAREQHAWPLLLAAFVLAGVGIGFAEPAESTLVALALPDRLRGNGFGVLGLVQSFGDLGASLVAGLIWALVSPTAAFGYAAAWMLAAVTAATFMTGRAALAADTAPDHR